MIQFDKHFFSKEKHHLEMACKILRLLPSGKALDFRKPLQARRVEQPEASTMGFFPVTMTNLNNFEVCVSILPKTFKRKAVYTKHPFFSCFSRGDSGSFLLGAARMVFDDLMYSSFLPWLFFLVKVYPGQKLTCPLKKDHFKKERIVFQPSVFKGRAVGFQGSICQLCIIMYHYVWRDAFLNMAGWPIVA